MRVLEYNREPKKVTEENRPMVGDAVLIRGKTLTITMIDWADGVAALNDGTAIRVDCLR